MEDPRDKFLENVDFCNIEIREYPKIAFLCGGSPNVLYNENSDQPHFPSVRSYISQFLTTTHSRIHFQNAEDIKDWNNYSAYDDLIEFEKDIAHICKAIVLFVESPGSIAELGSFAIIPEITEKLIVFLRTEFSNSTSFVSLGPIRRINKVRENRVHYIKWDLEEKNINGKKIEIVRTDSMDKWGSYTCDAIKGVLNTRLHIDHTSNEYTRTKQALFIHDIATLFNAVTDDEIIKYFKAVNHTIQQRDIQRSIFCLEKLTLIRSVRRGNKTYYTPENQSAGRYLTLNGGIDSARLAVQISEYYEHSSQFARREAITDTTRDER